MRRCGRRSMNEFKFLIVFGSVVYAAVMFFMLLVFV
jgi:hypothetical protein